MDRILMCAAAGAFSIQAVAQALAQVFAGINNSSGTIYVITPEGGMRQL
jgi:hypothetical protein